MKYPKVLYSKYDGMEWVRVKDYAFQPFSISEITEKTKKKKRRRKEIYVRYLDRYTLDNFGVGQGIEVRKGQTFSHFKRFLQRNRMSLSKEFSL